MRCHCKELGEYKSKFTAQTPSLTSTNAIELHGLIALLYKALTLFFLDFSSRLKRAHLPTSTELLGMTQALG